MHSTLSLSKGCSPVAGLRPPSSVFRLPTPDSRPPSALPLTLQSKFLKAIEEKWVRRLGAVRGQAVDVKIIAATTADLGVYAAQGRFRPDLYHRLAVVVVTLPPLHARAEDILPIAEHFLRRYAEAHLALPPGRL